MLHMPMRRAGLFRVHRSCFSTASETGSRARQFAVESDVSHLVSNNERHVTTIERKLVPREA